MIHERRDLFLLISGQEANILVKLGVGTADQNAPVSRFLLLQHGVQADSQGVEGFCCAGHPLYDHQRRFFRIGHQGLL